MAAGTRLWKQVAAAFCFSVAADALCREDQFEFGRLPLNCDGGSNSVIVSFSEAAVNHLQTFDAGIALDIVITLQTGVNILNQMDLELYNASNSTCAFGMEDSCKVKPPVTDFDWAGFTVTYSGDTSTIGVEQVSIRGEGLHDIAIAARSSGPATATLTYFWAPLSPCPKSPPGCPACSTYDGCGLDKRPVCDGTTFVKCFNLTTTTSSTTTTSNTNTTTSTMSTTSTLTTLTNTTVSSSTSTTSLSMSLSTTSTTTTTHNSTIIRGCYAVEWIEQSMLAPDVKGTTCRDWMEEYETCSFVCARGQVVGQALCVMGQLVGRPVCALEDVEYRTVFKIAGALQLVGSLPDGATLESPRLPQVIQVMMAGILQIDVQDFTMFRVTEPEVKVVYEFIVRDADRLDALVETCSAFETENGFLMTHASGPASTLTRILLYSGIRIIYIVAAFRPTAFQEVTEVGGEPDSLVVEAPIEYSLGTTGVVLGFTTISCMLPLLACILHSVSSRSSSSGQGMNDLLTGSSSATLRRRPRRRIFAVDDWLSNVQTTYLSWKASMQSMVSPRRPRGAQ